MRSSEQNNRSYDTYAGLVPRCPRDKSTQLKHVSHPLPFILPLPAPGKISSKQKGKAAHFLCLRSEHPFPCLPAGPFGPSDILWSHLGKLFEGYYYYYFKLGTNNSPFWRLSRSAMACVFGRSRQLDPKGLCRVGLSSQEKRIEMQ